MRLDTYKGIDIHVKPDSGKFCTGDPLMEADNLKEIKKMIRSWITKQRKLGFKPMEAVVIPADFDGDPVRGTLKGISGMNGSLRMEGLGDQWHTPRLVFRADKFPEELIRERNDLKNQMEVIEEKIKSIAWENNSHGGRLNATDVIEREQRLSEALQ